jgi:PKD repeat protein
VDRKTRLLAVAFLLVSSPLFAADPPPIKPVIVSRTVQPVVPGASQTVALDPWTTSQHYVALIPTTAEVLTYDYSDPNVLEVVTRNPGERFYGTPFDSPIGTHSSDKSWPDAKGAVAVLIGKAPGQCTISVWAVRDGKAVKVDTVLVTVGPRPPPPNPNPITLTATPSTGNAPLAVQFTASGDPAALAGIVTLDYGDGSTPTNYLPISHTYAAAGTYTAKLTAGGKVASAVVVVAGTPVPPVVTSFRVIFVTESAALLSPQQNAVINAKTTRDYCNAKCTRENNQPDWRSYDPQTGTTSGYVGIDTTWAAAKPKMTTIPNMIVEVNGKAEILPFPANAAACLATLQSYGGK